jgi:hypothetical protein
MKEKSVDSRPSTPQRTWRANDDGALKFCSGVNINMDDRRNTAFQSSSIQSYLRIIPGEDIAGGETGQHFVASDEAVGPDDEQLSVGQAA